jgi:hypothetical protein
MRSKHLGSQLPICNRIKHWVILQHLDESIRISAESSEIREERDKRFRWNLRLWCGSKDHRYQDCLKKPTRPDRIENLPTSMSAMQVVPTFYELLPNYHASPKKLCEPKCTANWCHGRTRQDIPLDALNRNRWIQNNIYNELTTSLQRANRCDNRMPYRAAPCSSPPERLILPFYSVTVYQLLKWLHRQMSFPLNISTTF